MLKMKDKPKISVVILTKNEAEMLPGCLATLSWCDEVILIDDNSTDGTVEIAENHGARVISFSHPSFARRRMEGKKHAQHEWIFYVDADERVTPALAEGLINLVSADKSVRAISFLRENYFYGQKMNHGGWQDDWVTRFFKKESLKKWYGTIHESPVFEGRLVRLSGAVLKHFSHRSTVDGLKKTIKWTPKEAQALVKALDETPKFKTILKKGLGEFWRRAIKNGGYKDGQVGLIEALIQAINRMLVYTQVWEQKQKPPINEVYKILEEQVKLEWENAK